MAKSHSPRFLAIVNEARKKINECTVADVHEMLENNEQFLLIDVREESEYAKGHLPGAIHLGKGILERDLEKLVPDTTSRIVLYCGGGFRSALAADAAQRMGYTSVISMDGGWSGWNEAGFAIENPA